MKFLEKQLKNTSSLKAKYKKEIQIQIEAVKKAKEEAESKGEEEVSPTRIKELAALGRKQRGTGDY